MINLRVKYLFTDFNLSAVGLEGKEPLAKDEVALFALPDYGWVDNSKVNYPITLIIVDNNLFYKKVRMEANAKIVTVIPKDTHVLIEANESLYDRIPEIGGTNFSALATNLIIKIA